MSDEKVSFAGQDIPHLGQVIPMEASMSESNDFGSEFGLPHTEHANIVPSNLVNKKM